MNTQMEKVRFENMTVIEKAEAIYEIIKAFAKNPEIRHPGKEVAKVVGLSERSIGDCIKIAEMLEKMRQNECLKQFPMKKLAKIARISKEEAEIKKEIAEAYRLYKEELKRIQVTHLKDSIKCTQKAKSDLIDIITNSKNVHLNLILNKFIFNLSSLEKSYQDALENSKKRVTEKVALI